MSWINAIEALRKHAGATNLPTIKPYHDKVQRLKGGKPDAFTDKEVKACQTKDLKAALTAGQGIAKPVQTIAKTKLRYQLPALETDTSALWVKAASALIKYGANSPQYSKAMKTYIAMLRQIDKWLADDIKTVEAALPVAENLIKSAKQEVALAKALDKVFANCLKTPALEKSKSVFTKLKGETSEYLKMLDGLTKAAPTVLSTCKEELAAIKTLKKTNLEWIRACEKQPPQDEKTMTKNAKAKSPSF